MVYLRSSEAGQKRKEISAQFWLSDTEDAFLTVTNPAIEEQLNYLSFNEYQTISWIESSLLSNFEKIEMEPSNDFSCSDSKNFTSSQILKETEVFENRMNEVRVVGTLTEDDGFDLEVVGSYFLICLPDKREINKHAALLVEQRRLIDTESLDVGRRVTLQRAGTLDLSGQGMRVVKVAGSTFLEHLYPASDAAQQRLALYSLERSSKVGVKQVPLEGLDLFSSIMHGYIFVGYLSKAAESDDYLLFYQIIPQGVSSASKIEETPSSVVLAGSKDQNCSTSRPKYTGDSQYSLFVFCIGQDTQNPRQVVWRLMFGRQSNLISFALKRVYKDERQVPEFGSEEAAGVVREPKYLSFEDWHIRLDFARSALLFKNVDLYTYFELNLLMIPLSQ